MSRVVELILLHIAFANLNTSFITKVGFSLTKNYT